MNQSLSRAWARLLVWLVVAGGLLTPVPGVLGEPSAKRAPARAEPTSTPKTVEDLRAIQARVERVVREATPAVVGVVVRNSQGSGVVVTRDGYVLTAAHVAAEPNHDVILIFPDGKRVHGKTLGINREMDAGMIRITDKGEWPFVEMGKASALRVGQWCVALGHPGGYRKDRTPPARLGRVLVSRPDLLVTSCTLMGGDSGGPLFDLSGKVIGIHSRIGQPTTANMHVPVDSFHETWDRLAKGEAWGKRPLYRGSAMLGVETELTDKGCVIRQVVEGSAAEKAGIKAGDLLLRFDGENVGNPDRLADLLSRHVPNEAAAVQVQRAGKTINLTVTLGVRP